MIKKIIGNYNPSLDVQEIIKKSGLIDMLQNNESLNIFLNRVTKNEPKAQYIIEDIELYIETAAKTKNFTPPYMVCNVAKTIYHKLVTVLNARMDVPDDIYNDEFVAPSTVELIYTVDRMCATSIENFMHIEFLLIVKTVYQLLLDEILRRIELSNATAYQKNQTLIKNDKFRNYLIPVNYIKQDFVLVAGIDPIDAHKRAQVIEEEDGSISKMMSEKVDMIVDSFEIEPQDYNDHTGDIIKECKQTVGTL